MKGMSKQHIVDAIASTVQTGHFSGQNTSFLFSDDSLTLNYAGPIDPMLLLCAGLEVMYPLYHGVRLFVEPGVIRIAGTFDQPATGPIYLRPEDIRRWEEAEEEKEHIIRKTREKYYGPKF